MESHVPVQTVEAQSRNQGAQHEAGFTQSVCVIAASATRAAFGGVRCLGSFISPLFEYFSACRRSRSISDWMRANKAMFGSELIYTDEIAGGFLVGYATGAAVRSALKFGLLLAGAGYLAVLAMSHYGVMTVNWHKVGETVGGPLNAAGAATVSSDNVRALRSKLKCLLQRSIPSTAGFAFGLAYNLTKG
ncbi:hypothetical protein Efla_006143 [Eimeria flavescens]